MAARSLGFSTTAEQALQGRSLAGKQAIVTGASSGIGLETARVLALAGADVVLAVRNVKLGEELAQRLRPQVSGKLEVQSLDLSDLESVSRFAKAWNRPLDVLIANAGVMATPELPTAQGFELQVGTNHLGHFALAKWLPPARVVVVSSTVHRRGNPERLIAALEKKKVRYASFGAYTDSKLANVLFAKGLAQRGVEAFSVHPGVIPTPISRTLGWWGATFQKIGKYLFVKSVEQGAATSIYAATAPRLPSGSYLSDCKVTEPSPLALDSTLVDRVWDLSELAIRR
jgi:NAD(P)-dependent dehydrogenase (short-subunit alcohol dehydrogenase family)